MVLDVTTSQDGFTLRRLRRPAAPVPVLRNAYECDTVTAAFQEALRELRPDVVHFHGIWGLSNDLPMLSNASGAKTLFTLHDFWLMCPRGQRLRPADGTVCWDLDLNRCAACLTPWIQPRRVAAAPTVIGVLRREGITNPALWRKAAARLLQPRRAADPASEVRHYHDKTRRIIEAVDLFIAPSQFLRSEFIRYGIAPSRIVHSDNGVDTSRLTRTKSRSDHVRFGFIGSLIPSKGVHVLIDAFRALDANAELLIFGGAPARDTSGYADQLRRRADHPRIRWMGRFDRHRVGDVLTEIDVLVMPSLWFENSPLVIKEAFAAGTPVIASRLGGMAEQIISGTNGVLVEPGSAVDLADAMAQLERGAFRALLRAGIPAVKTIEEHARELEILYGGGPVSHLPAAPLARAL